MLLQQRDICEQQQQGIKNSNKTKVEGCKKQKRRRGGRRPTVADVVVMQKLI